MAKNASVDSNGVGRTSRAQVEEITARFIMLGLPVMLQKSMVREMSEW